MTNREFDEIVDAVRNDVPNEQAIRESGERVRERLESAAAFGQSAHVDRIESCADYRALLPDYRSGNLGEARRMLVEDHLHTCVACRRVFQGKPAVVVSMTAPAARKPSIARRAVPIGIAAAIIAAMGFTLPPVFDRVMAPSGARATVASVEGGLYRVSDQGLMALSTGTALDEHDEIRTAKASRAVIQLRDGSRIEMAERSALTVSERWSGKTIFLDRGSVMVEAAKQRRGRLEIVTPDCAVSVKGTIFEVSRGTKGSRVSVVEGEVKVDRDNDTRLLHRGDQTATSPSMTATSVADDVAWSANSPKYLALLADFAVIQKKIEAIPAQGLRYQSNLTALVPGNTVIYAAIPNLATTLAEANSIFEAQVAESPVLKEWWNQNETQQLRTIVDQLKTFGDYLGDEIVLAVPAVNGKVQNPIVFAEVKKPGLQEFLDRQFANLKAAGSQTPAAKVTGNFVAIGGSDVRMANGEFLATPFGQNIAQSYRNGASWIFSADMEQIAHAHVNIPQNVAAAITSPGISGLDNVRYLTVERKTNLGRTENSASLSFGGSRQGMMSWLAAPGPMGTLDFMSQDTSFAVSFVMKNPAVVLQEFLSTGGSMAGLQKVLTGAQQETGVNLLNDIAANLGGEMTIAFDGPILPLPTWKVAIEVDNPAQLQAAIEKAVQAAQRDYPKSNVTLTTSTAGGLAYHKLTTTALPIEIDYVFSDGYLLIGSSQSVLELAIQNRAAGLTLPRSDAFRAQMPQDGHSNFSALVYYNMGPTVGPVVDQLKKSGLMTPELQHSIGGVATNREPGMIYAYGESDRIVVASRSGFFGLDLSTLLGLNANGMAALPQLLPLNFAKNIAGKK